MTGRRFLYTMHLNGGTPLADPQFRGLILEAVRGIAPGAESVGDSVVFEVDGDEKANQLGMTVFSQFPLIGRLRVEREVLSASRE